MKKFLLFPTLIISAINISIFFASAQEQIFPLTNNPVLQKASGTYRGGRSADTINLMKEAFWDDFSGSKYYPDERLWLDRYVFINSNLPFNPPSFNVATFDGLDEFGNPYSPGESNSKGKVADKLTSTYIDLSSLHEKDSVYLSFFYQPQGLGEYPDPYDSLVLEFKPLRYWNGTTWDSNAWIRVWSAAGTTRKNFRQVILPVRPYLIDTSQIIDTIAKFYYNAFQFRFKNYANLSGNLDHWHITYVYLNKGRSITDTLYHDVALSNRPVSILKDFTAMPWMHFKGNKNDVRQSMKIKAYNYSDTQIPLIARLTITDMEDNDLMYTSSHNHIFHYGDTSLIISNVLRDSIDFGKIVISDTIQIKSVLQLKLSDDHDKNNESVFINKFSNFYAYDDGTAEMGYGSSSGKYFAVAYKFKLPNSIPANDSLRGVYIYFNRSLNNVSNNAFKILVWDKGDYTTDPVSFEHRVPLIKNGEPNDFQLFIFKPALSVKGTFYIGWEQNSEFYINVGVDMNYYLLNDDTFPNVPNPNVFYKLNYQWEKTTLLYGALMIRPVFSENPIAFQEELNQVTLKPIIYPNPASDFVYISGKPGIRYFYSVYDFHGKLLKQGETKGEKADLSDLEMGMYLLMLRDLTDNTEYRYKIIVRK